ncbi:MAG: TIM barrel protein [Solidesulfovibrio sp. DCME]|uniref:TIM barrel protein n=1 Tax=Solidesulfovibrio sp. DCME TaxID=3447380 RepID=UPI003D0BF43A
MHTLLFGVSGLPLGNGEKFHYASGIAYLKAFGLDALELLFVRSVNVSARNSAAILREKAANAFHLSAHGSYYINLNAASAIKRQESLQRIASGAEALRLVGGRSLVFHPGFYLGKPPAEAWETIKDCLRRLPDDGIDYRLETTGKGTQCGTVPEIVALCRELPACKPCIDFAHIHARQNGGLRTYADFAHILDALLEGLGRAALDDLHIHMGGIAYGPKGEKHHLPLADSDFNYKACLQALRDYAVKGCVICEGPRLEYDAILLKNAYHRL